MPETATISIAAPPESTVVEMWERAAFAPDALQALGWSVVYRGTPADCGGPDYRDAILATHRAELVHGDIEFHVRSSDWYAHGHDRDSNYNSVILHVVWIADSTVTITSSGETVPVFELSRCVSRAVPTVTIDPYALAPYQCVTRLSRLPPDIVWQRIRAAGHSRLRSRADRIAAEIGESGPDQALYANLLEALGHAGNREGFRQLAEVAPFAWVYDLAPAERTPALLYSAGFAAQPAVMPPARLPVDTWRLSRLRPGNHPRDRIPAIAPLMHRFGREFALTATARTLDCNRPGALVEALSVRIGDVSPIGTGRAREMTDSVLLPFVLALSDDARVYELFDRAPAPPPTRWTRAFANLLPRVRPARTAAEHQGMHEIYVRHCRWERTSDCPLCGDSAGVQVGLRSQVPHGHDVLSPARGSGYRDPYLRA